jgi:hypothetical protein
MRPTALRKLLTVCLLAGVNLALWYCMIRTRPSPPAESANTQMDLAPLRQRVTALRQEVERARAAPNRADAYTPQTPGSIDDLATDAATLLRQLPDVVEVEALVTCAKPTRRIIHLRDFHWAAKEDCALEMSEALGRPVAGEELDLLYEEHLLRVELVQTEQLALLRCLVEHHGLKRVLSESLTPEGMGDFRQRLAEVRQIDAGLARLKEKRAELDGPAEEIDRGIAEMTRGRRRMLLEYGAAARLTLAGVLDLLPLEDGPLLAAAIADAGAMEARHDAEVKAALATGPVAFIVLGGWHDLSASVRRLGEGSTEYLRVTTRAVERFAGKGVLRE